MIKPHAIITELKKDLTGKTGRQTSTLYLAQIIALFLCVFTGSSSTKALGPEGYGILVFFLLPKQSILCQSPLNFHRSNPN
jgi:hypothetical protein